MKNQKSNVYFSPVLLLSAMIISTISCEKNKDEAIDRDGNVYKTVTIGTQTWMSENLKTTKYLNGDIIPTGLISTDWSNINSGAYAIFNDNAINNTTYGKLYNWYAIDDSRHLCPKGWHVPTNGEWTILITYLGGENVAGGMLKEIGTIHWSNPNTGATNESGFTAIPGGHRNLHGEYMGLGTLVQLWSSTEVDTYNSTLWGIQNNYSIIIGNPVSKNNGFSVRCIRD
jgi:uncharacterized protein (TIGR02145 family)